MRGQRGVTGLETAIILIAFVVVASVFAFTVLSTGIFSAERGKETIHAGLRGARSSLELKGSVIAEGVTNKTLSLGDTRWSTTTNSTSTINTTDKKEGTGSADVAVVGAFTTGTAAYVDLDATVDISKIDSIQLWVKSDISVSTGDLEIVVDDTAGCGSPLENLDLPVLVTSTWVLATLGITDNSDMTAIKCVGLSFTVDNGAQRVKTDNIFAQGQATALLITLANTLEGEAIDLSEPGDSDADGVADGDSIHSLILTYSDKNQVIRDVYWTKTFIGQNDSDSLLEAGEKVELNVRLTGLATSSPLLGDTRFDLELRPTSGGTVVIQRTMPDVIDSVMNLN